MSDACERRHDVYDPDENFLLVMFTRALNFGLCNSVVNLA